jgi:hypothetical protein
MNYIWKFISMATQDSEENKSRHSFFFDLASWWLEHVCFCVLKKNLFDFLLLINFF